MATIAQIQTALDPAGTGALAHILQSTHEDATFDSLYCVGMVEAPGRTRWCKVTNANTAAQQAQEIVQQLISTILPMVSANYIVDEAASNLILQEDNNGFLIQEN